MAVAVRNVTDISFLQRLDAETAVRAKHGDDYLTIHDVLPLIGGWMPVQFAQGPWIKFENGAGNRSRDRKARSIDPPLAAAPINSMGHLAEQAIFVGLRRQLPPLQRRGRLLRRDRAARK